MFYTSEKHKQRFTEVMLAKGKMTSDGKVIDSEYASALYILTISEAMWAKAQDHVVHGINIAEILKIEDLSGGYSALVHLAGNLYGGVERRGDTFEHIHCDALELMRLDPSNFQAALTAIQLRRDRDYIEQVDSLTAHHDQQYQVEQTGGIVSATKTGWKLTGQYGEYGIGTTLDLAIEAFAEQVMISRKEGK